VVVEASYPGANAQVVADTVAAPIEKQVNGLEHLAHMVSRCTNDGRYTLLLSFDSGIDLNVTQVLVQNRVNLADPVLPEAVKSKGVTTRKLSPGAVLIVVLTSPNAKYDTLYLGNYASLQIKDELARLPGVADVSLLGGEDYGVRILLDPDKLAARKLTSDDVLSAVREQNARAKTKPGDQPPAKPGEGFQLRLDTSGRLASAEEYEDIIVKTTPGGGLVRLRDVARVELGRGTSHGKARYDGHPAVALAISLLPTAKPRDVNIAVREKMDRLHKSFPAGVDYSVPVDLTGRNIVGKPLPPWCVLAELVLPSSASAERVGECQQRSSDILRKVSGVQHMLDLPENPFAFFRGGPCIVAVLESDLKDTESVKGTARKRLTEESRSAVVRLRELSSPAGLRLDGYPVDFALRGADDKAVRDFAETLAERLAQSGKLTDVASNSRTAPQFFVDVDRTKARAMGLSISDIFETLQVALGSADIGDANLVGHTAKVQVQLDAPARKGIEALKTVKVRNNKGEMVPLSAVVTIRETNGPMWVDRLDMRPAAIISGNPAAGVCLGEARWLCETLAEKVRVELRLPESYGLVWLQEVPAAKPIPGEPKAEPESQPKEVGVAQPTVREVTDYEDFTGRVDAAQKVELRARVTGYIDKIQFKEGSDVKKGDALVVIDPRPYQAALDEAQSKLKLAEAQRDLSKRTLERAKAAGAAVPQSEIDVAEATYQTAAAQVEAAKAIVKVAQLNLDFTTIRAPIDGRIGRCFTDPGNLVKADDTILATLVSLEPAYVYFDVDERMLLRLLRLARAGEKKTLTDPGLPAMMGLAGEKDFPHQGKVNFVDNQVNPDTGTLTLRAVLPNSDRSLRPGMFARVRLPIGAPHKALLVPEEAIHSDQGQKFVYVVEEGNKVASRTVTVGANQDGQRVIEKGLQPEDRVIVESRGRLRSGQIVKPVTAKP
jgi:RND family efflux transporter MFP subunit